MPLIIRVLRGWQEKTWSNAPCSVSPNAHPSPLLCGVSELLWLYLKTCHTHHILAWARPNISKKAWRDELLTFARQKKIQLWYRHRTTIWTSSQKAQGPAMEPEQIYRYCRYKYLLSITIAELDQAKFPNEPSRHWTALWHLQMLPRDWEGDNHLGHNSCQPNWNDQCTELFSIFVPKNLVWNAEQLTRDSIANSSHEVFNRFHVPWIQKTLEVPVNCSWIYWTLLYHGFPKKSQKSQKLGYNGYN